MRESEAREQSMRRQLDGLQGKLAEAEARAAVAGTQLGSAAHDGALADLRREIDQATQRMRASEQRSTELATALERAKAETAARAAVAVGPAMFGEPEAADERVRVAEAKAAKAIAAARAAAAGLTVSTADLAAIESGLVVPMEAQKKSPWLAITLAFIGGLGIMFVVWKLALNGKDEPKAAASVPPAPAPAQAAAAPPAPTPAPRPATPTVTPIEDQSAQPAATNDKPAPTVTPIEDPPKTEPKVE
ncbi:MAG: hypothetical protein H6Q90_4474, partial [Deltaproteobacteria bacterium]|nr:hypothetical protein [Deltaproteobacteria bacterium]